MEQHKIKTRLGCEGKYKIMVGKKPGGIESEQRIVTDWFPNLITNGGLDRLGITSFGNSNSYCQVGSGNTPPAVTDVNLASYVANRSYATTSVYSVDMVTLYQQNVLTYSFGLGVAEGNLAEVGIGWSSSTNLFSRALILDAGGSPTTITVLSDEYLTVVYSYRMYGLLADSTGSVTFTGNLAGTYNWTLRHSAFTNYLLTKSMSDVATAPSFYEGGIGIIGATPTHPSTAINGYVADAYVPGTYTSRMTMTAIPAYGNLAGGVKSISFRLGPWWQVEFDTPIPKTDQDSLSITFEMTWGRK